jgi:hypothetical protein
MRVTATIMCQDLDEAGVVIRDDVNDQEVVIPRDGIGNLITALAYFRDPASVADQFNSQDRSAAGDGGWSTRIVQDRPQT